MNSVTPKERSVDTRPLLLGVTGPWKSDGLDEEEKSTITDPHSLVRWEAKTCDSPVSHWLGDAVVGRFKFDDCSVLLYNPGRHVERS